MKKRKIEIKNTEQKLSKVEQEDGTILTIVKVVDESSFEQVEARTYSGKNLLSTTLVSQCTNIEDKGHGVYLKYTNIYDDSGRTIIDIKTSHVDKNGNELQEHILREFLGNDDRTQQLVNIVDINKVILIQEWRLIDETGTIVDTVLSKAKDSVTFDSRGKFFETLINFDTDGKGVVGKSAIDFVDGEYIELGSSDIRLVDGALVEYDD